MDTYGLINLSELDRMIEEHREVALKESNDEVIKSRISRIAALVKIKELCLKLPSGEDCFNAGVKYGRIMSEGQLEEPISYFEYITQFTKSDKHGS